MRLRLEFVPLALLLLGGGTQAGPVSLGQGAFARASDGVIPAAAHCGRRGQGACRAVRGTPGGSAYAPSGYYEHDANKLPFGSERWRDQMRRENRLGNPG